ncbi:MAG: trehalose-phosphatase [Betaproteobacteria bacterium]|nr:MAG: trehalose-phosphatase [Betaproteobacteria bacterium]
MPNSRSRSRDVAPEGPRRQPRQDEALADAGFPLGTVPRLPADAGFFLDIDGTLLDIAERPQLVRIDDDLGHLLATIRDASGGAVALISGRPVAEIDRLFGGNFCAAGQHGAERRDAAGRMHQHRVPLAGLRKALKHLRAMVAEHPALVLEDKGMNLALHYRSAPELGATVRETLGRLVDELGGDFELQSGKMVMEIKPSGKDKGTAIAEFLAEAPFRGRLPVFIGDDLTDEFGFELINRVGGCSVKVGEGSSAAHWRLPNADAVRAWLKRFAERGPEKS